jgi:integrase
VKNGSKLYNLYVTKASITLYRSNFLKLKKFPKPARDQLIIELPCDLGLRTGEIATLRIENIDLENGSILILDSKRYKPYPIPLSYNIAQLIEEVKSGRSEGWLIRQFPRSGKLSDKPITVEAIWHVWKKWAKRAGLPNWRQYTPRLGRHYFAATWHYVKHGNLEVLRRILRHKSLAYTQVYLSRLIFWEDEKAEYERIMNIPNLVKQEYVKTELTANLHENVNCIHEAMCKYYQRYEGHCIHEAVCKYFAKEKLSVKDSERVAAVV